ncbi:MAG: tetratricopeptide repeat protein [Elusimicrobiota bacterium]
MRALALLLVFSAVPAQAGRVEKARELYSEGLAQYRSGDLQSALATHSKAIAEHSDFLPAFIGRAHIRHILGDREGYQADLKRGMALGSSRKPEEMVARGEARTLAGDFKGALADFDAAIHADPQLADAYHGRGRVRRAMGDLAGAMADWSAALKNDPDLLMARYSMAVGLHESRADDAAIKELTRALNGNPKFALPYGLLGVIFAERGDFERALKAYSKAVQLMPTYAYALMGRAMVYMQTGKKSLAFNDLAEAAKCSPGDYAPLYNRGELYHRMGEKREAVEDYRRVLKLPIPDPQSALAVGQRFIEYALWEEAASMFSKALDAARSSPDPRLRVLQEDALLARARCLETLGQGKDALKDLNFAVQASSSSPRAWTERGKLLHRLGSRDAARGSLAEALELDGAFAPALLAQGNLKAESRDYDAAIEDFSSAIASDPGLSEAYNNRGVLRTRMLGGLDSGIADIMKAVELDAQDPVFHVNLGAAYVKHGDFWKAIAELDKALGLDGPKGRILQVRAEANAGLGLVSKAIKDVGDGLAADPKSAELFVTLGKIRHSMRDYPQAIRDLDKALALDKRFAQAYLHRGLAYGALGELRRAASDFGAAAEYGERPYEAYTYLCQTERLKGNPSRAVDACDRALAVHREYAPAYVHRGLAFLAVGSFERAVRDLDDGVRLGARYAEALLARSVSHAALRQYRQSDEAYREALAFDFLAKSCDITFGQEPLARWDYQFLIEDLSKTIDKDADDPYTHVVRGNALHNSARYDRAILEYTRAMEVNDRLTAAYLARGAALAAQDSMDAAEHDIRRAIELDPMDAFAHQSLVTLLTARRKYADGLKAVTAAMKVQPDNPRPDLFIKAGNLRYFLKDIRRASESYGLALKLDPGNPDAYNGLGLCRFAERGYNAALEHFSRAVLARPTDDRYYRNRASTFVNMGGFADAANDYKQALLVNRDPERVADYQKLIDSSEKMLEKPEGTQARKTSE